MYIRSASSKLQRCPTSAQLSVLKHLSFEAGLRAAELGSACALSTFCAHFCRSDIVFRHKFLSYMIGSQPAKYEYDGPSLISPAASAASSLIILIWRWMAAHGAVEQKNDFKTRTREYTPNFSLQSAAPEPEQLWGAPSLICRFYCMTWYFDLFKLVLIHLRPNLELI